MSGGTWNYDDRRLISLAGALREGTARWSDESDEEMELPTARLAMANLLDVTADLLHQMDYHLAGDSAIENEITWLLNAQHRLRATIDIFVQ